MKSLPYILLLGFCFGSNFVASRFAIGQFSVYTFVFLRLVLASSVYAVIYQFSRERKWPREPAFYLHGTVLGILAITLPMIFFNAALLYLSSGVTSVLRATEPALILVLAHFVLDGEKITASKIVGVVLALAGALLLALRGETGLLGVVQADPVGYLLALVALLGGSLGTIYARRFAQEYEPLDLTSYQTVVAAVVLSVIVLFRGGLEFNGVNGWGIFAIGYATIVSTLIGFMLFFYIIRNFGATAAAMTTYVIPIIATLGGVLILNETITAGMLVGMSLIVAGVWLVNR